MPIDLTITDLTEMSPGNYCVAGWDSHAQRMVRPLPEGRNWIGARLQQHGIRPGATIRFVPNGQAHPGQFPHSTEDTVVTAADIECLAPGPIAWFGPGAPPTHPTLQTAFAGNLQHNSVWDGARQGVYVPVGANCGSLAAIRLSRNRLEFVKEFDKLKAIVEDGDAQFKVSVSSEAIKSAWRNGGIAGVNAVLPVGAQFHVRLGLARPFGNPPDKCYLMINGIHG